MLKLVKEETRQDDIRTHRARSQLTLARIEKLPNIGTSWRTYCKDTINQTETLTATTRKMRSAGQRQVNVQDRDKSDVNATNSSHCNKTLRLGRTQTKFRKTLKYYLPRDECSMLHG